MANPLRFTYTNHADIALITNIPSVTSLPMSNLKDDDIQKLWRSSSANAAQALVIDLGGAQTIGCVALINSNTYAPATFDVRVSNTDPTGLDGGIYQVLDLPGIPDPLYNKFVHFIEPQVVGRYVRLTLGGLTIPPAPEAGRLVIGESWAPTRDMRYGFEPLWRDQSVRSRSLGGNEFIDVRPRQRGWRFTMLGLTESEAEEQVDRLNLLRGIGRDILICRDKDSVNLGRDTIWGLLEQPVAQRKTEAGYEIEVEIYDRV